MLDEVPRHGNTSTFPWSTLTVGFFERSKPESARLSASVAQPMRPWPYWWLAMPPNRDTAAALTRNTGASNRESRTRQNIAKVVTHVPGALELLQAGKVSAEHLAALAPIADKPGAQQLLAEATNKSPEMLARGAQQFKLSLECGSDVVKRQHAQRFVRLTDGPDGMIAITGLLPPRDGTNLKTCAGGQRWRRTGTLRGPRT